MKALLIVLAIGYGIAGLVGAASGATLWLSWLDVALGVAGLIAAFAVPATRAAEGGVAAALAVGAGVLWIIGLATHANTAMSWWTFAFGVAFALCGFAEAGNFRSAHQTA